MEQMITEGPNLNNVGWICPNCGASVNPNLSVCPKCKGSCHTTVYYAKEGPNVTTTWETNKLDNNEQIILS